MKQRLLLLRFALEICDLRSFIKVVFFGSRFLIVKNPGPASMGYNLSSAISSKISLLQTKKTSWVTEKKPQSSNKRINQTQGCATQTITEAATEEHYDAVMDVHLDDWNRDSDPDSHATQKRN